ncbi:PaaI family thioesterase [Undibacterium sp. LX40W]|uniref:PaaI family thioesterase n=1 Tax=Undibacterium nitidum TaxID=2762298 RepID=A0A923HU05_9BURK|nr:MULTISPECIES: PaaI family thioesterase [Undibacterium]MBC3883355.1 PaaI family thioesterase [Undibacterium nitidum]MBC3893637.1 PaaI family thioesterase [Undibacterium sp. LX40W]
MMQIEAMQAFLDREFPQSTVKVVSLGDKSTTVRQDISDAHLRPGGTVSGPVLMTVADVAMYVAVLNEIGIVPLAVTTNLNINFLRKPSAECAIIGVCHLLKVGKSLAVGEVGLYSEGSEDVVAHVVTTYAIPPKRD